MKKLVAALLVVGLQTTAIASDDWLEMGKTKESRYYINVRSISESTESGRAIVKAWFKEVIYNDLTKDGLTVGDSVLMLYHSNCKNNTIGMKSQVSYKNNQPFGKSINKTYVDMSDVIPDSIGESILSYSCGGLKIKQNYKEDY